MRVSRRRFLGGAAALVALPLLEGLAPRGARAVASAAPRRLVYYYLPNGRDPGTWVPTQTGANFALSQNMQPFAPYQSKMTVVSHLANVMDGGCDHAKSAGPALVCRPNPTVGSVLQNHVSADQLYAKQQTTPFNSLQWAAAEPGVADCGALSAFTQSLSWADQQTVLLPVTSPIAAFQQLFAGADPTATAAQQAQTLAQKKSILDFVMQDANSLTPRLSTDDSAKLDQYLTSIRQLETQLQTVNSCGSMPAPNALDYQGTVGAFHDMMVLALQCDMTRVITFMLEFELSLRVYDFLFPGQSTSQHHPLSHFGNDSQHQQLIAIEYWQAQQLASFVGKLAAIPEGSGTLLDNTLLVGLPGMGAGAIHDHSNICTAIFGSGGGAFKVGQHIDGQQQPLANLHIALLQALGMNISTFGSNGTAPVAGLL